jgi:hypothetical protein
VELLLADAARQLGIHPETLRRQVKRGERQARRDKHGRYWVDIPGSSTPHEATESSTHGVDDAYTPSRQEFERLLGEVTFLRHQLEEAATERAELRRMLNLEQQTVAAFSAPAALAGPAHDAAAQPECVHSAPDVAEVMQPPPAAETLAQALRDAGVKKKQRRKLLDRLASVWRGG